MVVFAVHLNQLRLKISTGLGEDHSQPVNGVAIKHFAPIFRHKDQMYVHVKNTMPSVSYVVDIIHRPNYNRSMKRLQAFKYELMPTGDQQRQIRRFAGSCRFVFNKALALQKQRHEQGEKKLGYAGLCKLLTDWRNYKETAWLADAPVHPLQQTLKDLERAYANFFAKRADFPRFKKKGQSDSFRYPDPKQIKLDQANSRLFLPKLGWLRYHNSREVLGTVKNITVSASNGKWFVSIQTEREVEQPLPNGSAVGIDMGIARFATLSDGTYVEPLNSFKRHETRLRRAQQAMSRKTKYSNNWKKAKARVQKIHSRIGNTRRDFLHKTSTAISQNHAMVCIEDLQVRNMSRSAAGSAEAPGRNVLAKSGLNKSILDQGWFEFRRQLDYKLGWRGGYLIAVSPHNTSRTCPCCGHVSADNRRTQARFECVACGFEENADLVGAINVLRRGEALLRNEGQDDARLACEVNGVQLCRQQQEPTEATQGRFNAGPERRRNLRSSGRGGCQTSDVDRLESSLYQVAGAGLKHDNLVVQASGEL
jgi:putative transposase